MTDSHGALILQIIKLEDALVYVLFMYALDALKLPLRRLKAGSYFAAYFSRKLVLMPSFAAAYH